MQSRHLSVVIDAAPQVVYAVAADPDLLPRWVAGLAAAELTRDGDDLVVPSPMGEVRVRYAPRNALDVLDHRVTLPSGETVLNPMRVVEHPDGAEVVFTVRQLGLTDTEFARDCAAVAADLERLRELVESGVRPAGTAAEGVRLRPVGPDDAAEMAEVLADPALYAFRAGPRLRGGGCAAAAVAAGR